MWRKAILSVITASLLTVAAIAQEQRSEISLQGTGFYTKDSTGQGIRQQATDTGGFLVGYRYHLNRWLAAETTYGFVRNTQTYSVPLALSGIQTDVHQAHTCWLKAGLSCSTQPKTHSWPGPTARREARSFTAAVGTSC
jgi:hypothetical protein